MAKYELPQSDFLPHPEGTFKGFIADVVDRGEQETAYGTKHRMSIHIESETCLMEDGRPWVHYVWCNFASGGNATLTKLRQKLLKRTLTPDEKKTFDADTEMIGRHIEYQIEHAYGENGQTYANLVTWRLLDGPPHPAQEAREKVLAGQEEEAAPGDGSAPPWEGDEPPSPEYEEEPLPF